MIRPQSYEEQIKQLRADNDALTACSLEMQSRMKESHIRRTNDKKLLTKGLESLQNKRERIDAINAQRAQRG